MALTLNKNTSVGELSMENQLSSQKPSRVVIGSIDWDASYPTGGEDFTPSQIGLKTIEHIVFAPKDGLLAEFDSAANKVKAFFFDYNNASDGLAIEVSDTFDLSAVTGMQFFAIGSV